MTEGLKIAVIVLLNVGYGFLIAYILLVLLLVAFNKTKGAGENPEGKMFMPVGWLGIALIPCLFFLMNQVVTTKLFSNKKQMPLCVVAAVIGITIGVLLINVNYLVNYINLLNKLGL